MIEVESNFRNILGYASGSTQFESVDGGELDRRLTELLLPSALKVFKEENNPEAMKHSRIYSLYVNLLLPGQSIQLHTDVPELLGVDRSNCHHSAQARARHSVPGQGVEVPCVPLHCSVEHSQAGWRCPVYHCTALWSIAR